MWLLAVLSASSGLLLMPNPRFPPGLRVFDGRGLSGEEEVAELTVPMRSSARQYYRLVSCLFDEHVDLSCRVLATSVNLLSASVSLCLPCDRKGGCSKQEFLSDFLNLRGDSMPSYGLRKHS